jgi:hypothetical protein
VVPHLRISASRFARALTLAVAISLCRPDFTSVGVAADGEQPPLGEVPAARVDDFGKLRPGLKKVDVDRILKTSGEHEFSFEDDKGHAWAVGFYLIECSSCFFLFRDQRLVGLCESDISAGPRSKRSHGPSPSDLPLELEDDREIKRDMGAPWIRDEELSKAIDRLKNSFAESERHYQQLMKQQRPNPFLAEVFARAGLFSPESRAEMRQALRENEVYRKKFNRWNAQIGMPRAKVDEVFGTPQYHTSLPKGVQLAIYGPKNPPPSRVPGDVRCLAFAVWFRNGRVVRVVKEGLFNTEWKIKVPPA